MRRVLTKLSSFLAITLLVGPTATAQAVVAEPPTEDHGMPVRVQTLMSAGKVIENLRDQAEVIWLEGDVLWLAKRSDQGPWSISGTFSHELTRIERSDLWAVGLRWNQWPEAMINVSFIRTDTQGEKSQQYQWRGDRAPAMASQAEPLIIETLEMNGPGGHKQRKITIVLPPGRQTDQPLPAVLLADGQSAERWGRVIAALVKEGKARPVAVIGVHSGGYKGDRAEPYNPELDVRAMEYLEGFAPERFDAHLSWVIGTVLPEVSRRYMISTEREDLAVAGFSNGGAFAATAAARRSDVFGAAITLSVGVPPEAEVFNAQAPRVDLYLAAGELEPHFLEGTKATRDRAKKAGWETAFRSYAAGHDADMWVLAAEQFVPLIFPPGRSQD